MEKITYCGDDCLSCPRYLAKTEDELSRVAELWYRIGWRDSIVSADEIRCGGCFPHKSCTYNLIECIKNNGVEKCNKCGLFPCKKINDMLLRSKQYQERCRVICSEEEYNLLAKSFFNKEENLKK